MNLSYLYLIQKKKLTYKQLFSILHDKETDFLHNHLRYNYSEQLLFKCIKELPLTEEKAKLCLACKHKNYQNHTKPVRECVRCWCDFLTNKDLYLKKKVSKLSMFQEPKKKKLPSFLK